MTDADVERLVNHSRSLGHPLDRYGAASFLGAREILAREPGNANARETVEQYQRYLTTGRRPEGFFAELFLPIPYTDEEIAAQKKSREGHLAAIAKKENPGGATADAAGVH